MLALIVNFLRARIIEHRDRARLRELLEKDDRLLDDAGLTRADIESALSKPMGIGSRAEAYRLSRQSLMLDRAIIR